VDNSLSLQEQVVAALRRISRAIDLHSRLLLQKNGLTTPQLASLRVVERLQPVSVGRIAKEIHLSPATVTGILGRLETRGLVTRAMGNHDRRSVLVELTPEGTRLLGEAPSPLQERFQRELGKLEQWEQTMILGTLQRIASMMDAEKIEAAPVLVAGVAGASAEDVSRYLEKAVVASDDSPLAEESPSGVYPPGNPAGTEDSMTPGGRQIMAAASPGGGREPQAGA
jgi:DNA-binding MarR family transcriptional regulator